MFNLYDTGHEAGIVLYSGNAVGVFNWSNCPDGCIPMVGPIGMQIDWPVANEEVELRHVASVDDVRERLPGAVWAEDGELVTDLDIAYDDNADIPALFGFGDEASDYEGLKNPYSGDVWEIPGTEYQVLTIDLWI